MKSVIICSTCGSSNDLSDIFCYTCGSKLTKEKFPSDLTVEEDSNLFSMIRTTIYEGQSTIYEFNNPNFVYKINNVHTISTKWLISLAIVVIILFGVYIGSSALAFNSSGPDFIFLPF